MTMSDVATHWLEEYERLTADAEAFRDSQSVSFGLMALYDELTEPEKERVHQILANWLVSDDNKLRYDAAFLTSERRIRELKPAVEKAIERATRRFGPEATFEARKLRRILDELK